MYEKKEQSFTWPTESNVDTGVTIGNKNGRDCTELLNAKVLKSTSHVTHYFLACHTFTQDSILSLITTTSC